MINSLKFPIKPKILILGDARHGKDTLADLICAKYGLTSESSSRAALRIFLYDILINEYKREYKTEDEAYEDRIYIRDIWYDEICLYNKDDKTRLVKEILKSSNVYIGLRSDIEVEQAIEESLFDMIIGIYDYRKLRESNDSNTADVFKYSDIVFINNGTIGDLKNKVLEYL